MEVIDFSNDYEVIKDYRMFLMDLDKKFKSVGLLYREFKVLEDLASTALKVTPVLHDFVSKQQSAVYEKLQAEIGSLSEIVRRGRVLYQK